MNGDLERYISIRCERALSESDEYRQLKKQSIEAYNKKDFAAYSDINTAIQILVENTCYKAGAKDMLSTIDELK